MVANFILKAVVVALSISNVHSLAIPDASANPAAETAAILSKRFAHCGSSTFIDRTIGLGASPRATDCSKLSNRVRATPSLSGEFNRDGGYSVVEGSCKFSARTANVLRTFIGNEDVADLLRDSVIKFKRNHQVAAEGDMGCSNSLGGTSKVLWTINRP